MARFDVQRGNMRSGSDDLADRWYVVDGEADAIDKRGRGFATRAEALEMVIERLTSSPDPADLVGVSEIAARAGVKADTIQAWRSRHATFPAPVIALAMGPVWDWSDVAAWLAIPRPAGRPKG